MDISYLLWLQDLRNATHNAWTPFMAGISQFSVSYLLCVPAFLYWCWDKKRGLQTLAAFSLSVAVASVVKLTACVYRPWIKDPHIIPAVKSLPSSYSFPSGHTSMGTPLYLGSALIFWRKKQTKVIAVLFVVFALLNAFSRNYLGVHTPQDVFVGLLLSIICLYAAWKAGAYFQQHPEKENRFLAVVSVVGILAFIYVLYKPYPLDYIDGKLLVNPQKMLKNAFEGIGVLLGFCAARYIEKTWIGFKETGLNFKGIGWGLIGFIPLYLFFVYAGKPLRHLLGANWGRFTWSALLMVYIIALYPLILKWLYSKKIAK